MQIREKINLYKPRKKILIAILITLSAMAFFWILFPPHFTETTDDMIMASFSYGYMGEYTSKLVYINILIGYALKTCMIIMPHIPWYSIFQCLIIFVSFAVIIFLILEKFDGILSAFPITLILAYFGYQFFSSLQFTKTASIASIAGALLMFYAIQKQKKWLLHVFAGFLLLIGSLYRFRMFEIVLLFMAGLGIIEVCRCIKQKKWLHLAKLCVPFLVVLFICFSCKMYDTWVYSHTPGWENYWEYNQLRDTLQNSLHNGSGGTGFPNYEENQELYSSLDITENDYNLYRSANFADTELFTEDIIRELVNVKGNISINKQFVKSFFSQNVAQLINYSFFPAVCIAAIFCILQFQKKKRMQYLLFIYEILSFGIVQLYFYWRGRYLQNRVDVGIFLTMTLIFLLHGYGENTFLPKKKNILILLAGIMAFSSVSYHTEQYKSDLKNRETSVSINEMRHLISTDQEHFYFYYTSWSVYPDWLCNIKTVGQKGCGKNTSALGTWRVSTYTVQQKWQQYGITNPYRDMIDNPDVLVVCPNEAAAEQILTHLREHYNTEINAYMVKIISGLYPVYRFSSVDLSLDTSSAINNKDILSSDSTYDADINQGILHVSGELYKENSNSFASNIYIGISSEDEEIFYYTTQLENINDNSTSKYGTFNCDVPLPETGCEINLYLQQDGKLYKVSVGELTY